MLLKVWVSHWQIISVISGSRSILAKTILGRGGGGGGRVELYFYPEVCWCSCLCMYYFVTYLDALSSAKGPCF